jgi:hypothetical protein
MALTSRANPAQPGYLNALAFVSRRRSAPIQASFDIE